MISPRCFEETWIREQAAALKARDLRTLEKNILALELVSRLQSIVASTGASADPRPMKVVKHLFDVAELASIAGNLSEAVQTYRVIHAEQLRWRGGEWTTYHEAEQFEFTFDTIESKESEALFPACMVTGRFDNLHLVAFKDGEQLGAQLLTLDAISSHEGSVYLSVPITILNPCALDWLEHSGHVPQGSDAIQVLNDWFRKEASAEWERIKKSRDKGQQQTLIFDDPTQLKLH